MAGDGTAQRSGMSRRELIRNAGIAGAAAWTAPAIIGSLASPAAAQTPGGSVNCSKAIVLFRKPGDAVTVYGTGYQNTCVGCGCFGNFSASNLSPGPPLFFQFGALWFEINVGTTNIQWGATCATTSTLITAENSPGCNTFLTVDSNTGTVMPTAGTTILGAIAFHANQLTGFEPTGGNLVFGDCIGPETGLTACP